MSSCWFFSILTAEDSHVILITSLSTPRNAHSCTLANSASFKCFFSTFPPGDAASTATAAAVESASGKRQKPSMNLNPVHFNKQHSSNAIPKNPVVSFRGKKCKRAPKQLFSKFQHCVEALSYNESADPSTGSKAGFSQKSEINNRWLGGDLTVSSSACPQWSFHNKAWWGTHAVTVVTQNSSHIFPTTDQNDSRLRAAAVVAYLPTFP